MRLNKLKIAFLLLLSACTSIESSKVSYQHFRAQPVKIVLLNYSDYSLVRTEPDMGAWVVGAANKNFIDSRKDILKEAANNVMSSKCTNYRVVSDYNYSMSVSQNTNELISSVILTAKEKLAPSYEKLPLSMEVEFKCN